LGDTAGRLADVLAAEVVDHDGEFAETAECRQLGRRLITGVANALVDAAE